LNKALSRITIIFVCILLFLPFSISGPALRDRSEASNDAPIIATTEEPIHSAVPVRNVNSIERVAKDPKKEIDKMSIGRNVLTGRIVEKPKLIDVKEVRELVGAEDEKTPYVVERPELVKCNSVRTEVYEKAVFDCSEGVTKLDNKETTLFTDRQGDYAYIESIIPVEEAPRHILRVVQGVEFPTQQTTSVYAKEDEAWKHVCNIKGIGREPTVSTCDVTGFANEGAVEIRIENYAREGEARWSVNSVEILRKGTPDLATPTKIVTPTKIIPPVDGGDDGGGLITTGDVDGITLSSGSRGTKITGPVILVPFFDEEITTPITIIPTEVGGGAINDFALFGNLEEEIPVPETTLEEETELVGVEGFENQGAGDATDNTGAEPQSNTPITGAVTGLDFLRENGADFGLGLMILVMAGLYGQHFRRKRY